MLSSRATLLARILANPLIRRAAAGQQQAVRRSHAAWNYRKGPDYKSHSKFVQYAPYGIGGFMWWWVFWHLWHEPDHITGEFPEPDPKLWTDKELGIPPDDFDDE